MSITHEVTIWCDICAQWEQASETTTKDFRKQLKKRKGWFFKDGKDICNFCMYLNTIKKENSDER